MLTMRIDERHAGFPRLAIGGYVAGLAVLGDALVRDGEQVATIRVTDLDLRPPRAVERREAEAATESYLGLRHHFFPGCFCCGPARAAGDGLRIFATDVGNGLVAAPWRPADAVEGAHVPAEIVWSALDCPGIWAQVLVTSATGERAVTGSLAVVQVRQVPVDGTHVVLGWPIGREGRKIYVGAAITSERGEVLALARQTLIVTERGVPLDNEAWQSAPAP